MTSPMNAAARAALQTARALAYVDAVYKRGTNACPIRPVKSGVDVELLAGDGSVTIARATLWRLPADELVIQGEEIEPREGDTIEEQVGGKQQVYKVQAVGGDSCFEPTDPGQSGYLIRSRMIDDGN